MQVRDLRPPRGRGFLRQLVGGFHTFICAVGSLDKLHRRHSVYSLQRLIESGLQNRLGLRAASHFPLAQPVNNGLAIAAQAHGRIRRNFPEGGGNRKNLDEVGRVGNRGGAWVAQMAGAFMGMARMFDNIADTGAVGGMTVTAVRPDIIYILLFTHGGDTRVGPDFIASFSGIPFAA